MLMFKENKLYRCDLFQNNCFGSQTQICFILFYFIYLENIGITELKIP